MEGQYPVYAGDRQVGKVCVLRQGLYYKFRCRCRPDGGAVCRLRVRLEGTQADLGILVPMGDGFGLDTAVPAKRFGSGVPVFRVVPKTEKGTAAFLPVYPEEPFAYISRLKDAYLVRQGGVTGITIK